MISEDVWTRVGGTQRNLMRLFFHPNGVKPFVTNWTAIAPLLWQRAHREAEALGGQEMKQVLSELSQYQNADTLWAAEDAALVPVLPLEIAKDSMRISLFTVIATFGTAQDVTADELWIESLLPPMRRPSAFQRCRRWVSGSARASLIHPLSPIHSRRASQSALLRGRSQHHQRERADAAPHGEQLPHA